MRILHVYKDVYPPVHGGIEKHIHELATGLQRSGLDVQVLVSGSRRSADTFKIGEVSVVRTGEWYRAMSAPLSPTFPFWLRRLGMEKDILHFHCPNPTGEVSFLLSGLDTPVVATYHSDIVRQRVAGTLYQPLLRRFLHKTTRILVSTPNHIRMSPHLTAFKDKCIVVPFGIRPERFACTPTVARKVADLQAARGGPLILFVGKFRYYKGLSTLLQALPQLPAKLLLVGEGPMEPELRRLVTTLRLGDRVFFEGSVLDSELPIYYHACQVFVLPSTHKSEAFGIVLLEAMACGKPVVTTELGTGTSYVNQHGTTGLVVPPGDVASLTGAIRRLLDDPRLRERFGCAGYERVCREYCTQRMVEGVLDTYQRVLQQRGRRRV